MRGDSLYCPLPLSLDSYGNCLEDCHHCYFRNLNHVWGTDLKPLDMDLLRKKLINGLSNKNPKSTLAWALSQQKTIRWGNKSDPFQTIERTYKRAPKVFALLMELNWSFVIQTRFTGVLSDYQKYIKRASAKNLITIMPVISPGGEMDWEVLERKRTTPILERLQHLSEWMAEGIPVGVNGEPFIPGYHTVKNFEDTLKLLKSYGVKSYNTYNFHFNAFVAKNLHAIGIDIEKIWRMNQDAQWKPILQQLLDISKKHGFILGCPDFVNSGKDWIEKANTCCGINVPNPCTFNTHHFKKALQNGLSDIDIFNTTNDGTGNSTEGMSIIKGTCSKMYNLNDIV